MILYLILLSFVNDLTLACSVETGSPVKCAGPRKARDQKNNRRKDRTEKFGSKLHDWKMPDQKMWDIILSKVNMAAALMLYRIM